MSDRIETPGQRPPRSSRKRYRAFVRDYKARRLDDLVENGDEQKSRPDGEPGAASTSAPRSRQERKARRREYAREYVRWLWPHRYAVGALFLFALVAAALEMAEPLFMRFIIDKVLLNVGLDSASRLTRLNLAGGFFVCVVVLSKLIGVFKDYRQRLVNVHVMLSLRQSLFDRLLHRP